MHRVQELNQAQTEGGSVQEEQIINIKRNSKIKIAGPSSQKNVEYGDVH